MVAENTLFPVDSKADLQALNFQDQTKIFHLGVQSYKWFYIWIHVQNPVIADLDLITKGRLAISDTDRFDVQQLPVKKQ